MASFKNEPSFGAADASFVRKLATYGRALECIYPGYNNKNKNMEILMSIESNMVPQLDLNFESIRIATIAINTFNHWKLFTARRTSGYVMSRYESGNLN